MKIKVLGSGTGVPQLKRAAPGYFLRMNEVTALLDAGPGTLQRLVRAGGDYRFLQALFFTHAHPDHISDLIPLLFALKYTPGFERKKPLKIFGPPVLSTFLKNAALLYGNWLQNLPFELQVTESEQGKATLEGLKVRWVKMNHSAPTVGYRFDTPSGHSFVFSGDTDVTPNLPELAQATDLLILECSFPDDQKVEGHLTPHEAGKMAALAGAQKLLLTHFYPPCDAIDPLPSVRSYFGGEVQKAQDGLTLEI